MIILLVWIFFTLLGFHLCTHYSKAGRIINKIPGPKILPVVGNLLMLHISPERVYKRIGEIADEYYPIFRFWFPSFPMVFIRDPDDIKEILSSKVNIDKGSAYDNMRFCGNDGLILNSGDKWYRRRKLLNHAFSTGMMRVNLNIVNEHAQKFVRNLEKQGDESVQELIPVMVRLTMNIMCETGMGVNLENSSVKGGELFRDAIDFALDVTLYRTLRPYITDPMMKFIPMGRKQDYLLREGRNFRDEVIENRRKYYKEAGYEVLKESIDNDHVDNHAERTGHQGLSVIDILLSAEKDGLIDNKGLADEVETFIAAGSDTTAMTMTYLLLQLSENKSAQKLARNEVREIFKQCDGKLTLDDVKKLDYVERCIKESLRILPTVPKITRALRQETKLSGYTVPAHTEVVMLIHEIHRDPKYWPQPEKFDPDRFLPENSRNRHPHAYIPFSAGPRQCIGYKHAMVTLKILLATILNKFELETVQPITEIDFQITMDLKPIKPVYVKFIKINDDE